MHSNSRSSETALSGAPASGTRLTWIGLGFIVLAAMAIGWPGTEGFWGRDDYMQLAMARLIGSPWVLFVTDHFVAAPGAVFRPMGFASFWLGHALFGAEYAPHIAFSLALHALVAVGVFAVARAAGAGRVPAFVGTMVFIAHPAVTGTALWWSARFDVLATGFGLFALAAALKYRRGASGLYLPLTLIALLAAMLSKEIGLVAAAVVAFVWLAWVRDARQRRRALIAAGLAALSAIVFLVLRGLVLGTFGSSLTGAMSLPATLASGTITWLQLAPDYLLWWPRLGVPGRIALVAVLGVTVAGLWFARGNGREGNRAVSPFTLLACGLGLTLLPALLQAPIVILNAAELTASMSAVEAAMQSRLFYLTLAGVGLVVAAVIEFFQPDWRRIPGLVSALALALLVGAAAATSHQHSEQFARRSADIGHIATEALAAVDRLDLPAANCHVLFLDVPTPPEWEIYVSMDSAIKALHPDLGEVGHCFFHADYRTFFHLLDRRPDPREYAPFEPLRINGAALDPVRIGGMTAVYLLHPERLGRDGIERLMVLRYTTQGFDRSSVEPGEWPLAAASAQQPGE